jgi:hypothetical protein
MKAKGTARFPAETRRGREQKINKDNGCKGRKRKIARDAAANPVFIQKHLSFPEFRRFYVFFFLRVPASAESFQLSLAVYFAFRLPPSAFILLPFS